MKGILIEKQDNGSRASITDIDEANLPAGDVTVRVEWSTLNYKDALAITGRSPVVRSFPLVPGIDFAGVVEASGHAQWKAGDHVILNGYGARPTRGDPTPETMRFPARAAATSLFSIHHSIRSVGRSWTS